MLITLSSLDIEMIIIIIIIIINIIIINFIFRTKFIDYITNQFDNNVPPNYDDGKLMRYLAVHHYVNSNPKFAHCNYFAKMGEIWG